MLPLVMMVEIDGQEVVVTFNAIVGLLDDAERAAHKNLIALCREDSDFLQDGQAPPPGVDVNKVANRLFQNLLFFYLTVKDRLQSRLRDWSKTPTAEPFIVENWAETTLINADWSKAGRA